MYEALSYYYYRLPLAHVIGTKVLVLHGGLFSKPDTSLQTLRQIDRHREPPDEGPMTEMLWYFAFFHY